MKKILFWLLGIVIIIAVALVGLNYLSVKKPLIFKVPGGGMEPTIKIGEKIGIDRFAYTNEEPQRGDIIVFQEKETKLQVMRIMGLPGETLEMKNGSVLIDGQEIKSGFYYYNAGEYGREGQK